jgi:dipicolinate synthase subunit A
MVARPSTRNVRNRPRKEVVDVARLVLFGGDRREAEAARLLAERGHEVATVGGLMPPGAGLEARDPLPALAGADMVVGPALGTVGGGDAFFRASPLPPLAIEPQWLAVTPPLVPWLVGRPPGPWLRRAAAAAGVPLVVYGEREDYALLNAIPTAEGAVSEACQLAGRTVWGQRALVSGGGRCGQALVARLRAWGADVVCAARRPLARAAAQAAGARTIPMEWMASEARQCQFVFNTVPAPVIGRPLLATLAPGSVVVDVASAPGGTDFAAAEQLGVPARLLPGIPGRLYPRTAGRILADVVEAVLSEGVADPRSAAEEA